MKRPLVTLLLLVPALAQAQQLICIDPGHGGMDPGGVGTGMQEKHIVLDTASRFRDLLEADTADTAGGGEWMVIMTRGDDTFVGLSARAAYANDRGADRFMSIHSNAFADPSANGTETFSLTEGGTGSALRNLVQEEMIAAWGLRNRGNKTANFAVLRETSMPAELHELAFITNAVDAAKLANPADRQLAAAAHLKAIQRHFGLAAYIPGDPPLPDVSGDIAGTVVDPEGPVQGATVTLDGADPVLTGADGAFRFDDVAPGLHTVEAQAVGRRPGSADVDVLAGQTANLEVSLDLDDDGTPDPPDPPDSMGGDDDMAGGCGCRAGSRPGPTRAAGALLLVLGGWLLRRKRRVRV
jgi:N-acetylmuramoyl-L-alanine amidase